VRPLLTGGARWRPVSLLAVRAYAELDLPVATVTRGRSGGYARAVAPGRTPEGLVLPEEQSRHLQEIEAAFRYANLEVGYRLQRLKASTAMVILASNLRENIDAAFTRRFHFVVNFPRPGPAERHRLWRLAFPPEAPLATDVWTCPRCADWT
jgi:hypothetical protein